MTRPRRPLSFAIAAVAGWLAAARVARAADDDACPKQDGCTEACELPPAPAEAPSPQFLSKLRSIGSTGYRVDASLGAALLERRGWLGVLNIAGLSPEDAKRWEQDGRYAGPCAGLVVVFWSRVVDARIRKNAVDLYELRYRGEAQAARVAKLLTDPARPWDWNYRPFSAVAAGRSVFVIEGRHHAWPALMRVAAHFGGKLRPDGGVETRSCDPEVETKPLVALPIDGTGAPLSLFALGFSPSGLFAWLEQRHDTSGPDVEWSLHVTDLVNDSVVATESFKVSRAGLVGLCVRYGRDLARLLLPHHIQGTAALALEQPQPGKDPIGVETRRVDADAGGTTYDVILRARAGSKRIASVEQEAPASGAGAGAAPKILGIVRSPFESRVAVAVAQDVAGTAGGRVMRVQFFGGRLDRGFRLDPVPAR